MYYISLALKYRNDTDTLEVTLPGAITANSVLSFDYWREVESYSGAYDQTVVELSTDGGATWSDLWYRDSSDASQATWLSSGNINLGAYAGADVTVPRSMRWYNGRVLQNEREVES